MRIGCHESFDEGPHFSISHFNIDISPLTFLCLVLLLGAMTSIVYLIASLLPRGGTPPVPDNVKRIAPLYILAGFFFSVVACLFNTLAIHSLHTPAGHHTVFEMKLCTMVIFCSDFLCIAVWYLSYRGLRGLLKDTGTVAFYVLSGISIFIYSMSDYLAFMGYVGFILGLFVFCYPFLFLFLYCRFFRGPKQLGRKGILGLAFFFWFSVVVHLFTGNFYYSLGQDYDGIIGTWVIAAILFYLVFTLLNIDDTHRMRWSELGWVLLSTLVAGRLCAEVTNGSSREVKKIVATCILTSRDGSKRDTQDSPVGTLQPKEKKEVYFLFPLINGGSDRTHTFSVTGE
jgi:hypothetical protein